MRGIIVSGLRPNSIRNGKVRFTVDAFSTDDPFDPWPRGSTLVDPRMGVGDVTVRRGLDRVVCRSHVGCAAIIRYAVSSPRACRLAWLDVHFVVEGHLCRSSIHRTSSGVSTPSIS